MNTAYVATVLSTESLLTLVLGPNVWKSTIFWHRTRSLEPLKGVHKTLVVIDFGNTGDNCSWH